MADHPPASRPWTALTQLRLRKGWSLRRAAAAVGIGEVHYRQIESNTRGYASADVLKRIADTYEVDVIELLETRPPRPRASRRQHSKVA